MQRRIFVLLLAIVLILSLTGCTNFNNLINSSSTKYTNPPTYSTIIDGPDADYSVPESNNPDGYEVIYDCNNGYRFSSTTTIDNKILKPEDPKKICSAFLYWCTDKELQNEFNFDTLVKADTTLYAKYYTDFAELTNYVTSISMKATVRIECKFYNSTFSQSYSTSLGSGIIFAENYYYYYCLTNNHVVYGGNSYRYSEYTVEDCYENEYKGTLIARDPNYDLAILSFSKADEELGIIDLYEDESYLEPNEYVIALGEPLGQSNTIRYGKIVSTSEEFVPDPETIEESNVTFNVISHTTFIDNGSSGGALIDTNLNLIGINFAALTDGKTDEFKRSLAIPISKVKEFIANNYV